MQLCNVQICSEYTEDKMLNFLSVPVSSDAYLLKIVIRLESELNVNILDFSNGNY